jgi:hypothetical protein
MLTTMTKFIIIVGAVAVFSPSSTSAAPQVEQHYVIRWTCPATSSRGECQALMGGQTDTVGNFESEGSCTDFLIADRTSGGPRKSGLPQDSRCEPGPSTVTDAASQSMLQNLVELAILTKPDLLPAIAGVGLVNNLFDFWNKSELEKAATKAAEEASNAAERRRMAHEKFIRDGLTRQQLLATLKGLNNPFTPALKPVGSETVLMLKPIGGGDLPVEIQRGPLGTTEVKPLELKPLDPQMYETSKLNALQQFACAQALVERGDGASAAEAINFLAGMPSRVPCRAGASISTDAVADPPRVTVRPSEQLQYEIDLLSREAVAIAKRDELQRRRHVIKTLQDAIDKKRLDAQKRIDDILAAEARLRREEPRVPQSAFVQPADVPQSPDATKPADRVGAERPVESPDLAEARRQLAEANRIEGETESILSEQDAKIQQDLADLASDIAKTRELSTAAKAEKN